ncbi:hypothetical protein EV210_101218 [Anaerospora hongkongensis]|uniref:Uncharacterized protein n=1 Tax=Anaerospora hongkongensis TaxID=244830 RepID=A0A4R1Q3F7_9FIRM|nr:hypothetical protein [Anaerospora hongkongensis]TCL40018.1 hypothetical protein EV210_101218 [Anaerospora hongkongensis]
MTLAKEELEMIHKLQKDGLTAKAIGQKIGCATSTIEDRLKIMGYTCNGGSGHGGKRPGCGRKSSKSKSEIRLRSYQKEALSYLLSGEKSLP